MKTWTTQGCSVIEADTHKVITQTPQRSTSRMGTHGYAEALREDEENTRLLAAAPELSAELKLAHQIIRNALNIMTLEQKTAWAAANERDGVSGEGATRANERETIINKADGRA